MTVQTTHSDRLIQAVASKYGLNNIDVLSEHRGYRNYVYRISLDKSEPACVIIYKNEPGIVSKISAAHYVSNKIKNPKLPIRRPVVDRILKIKMSAGPRYAAVYDFLPGDTIPWEAYTKDHIKCLGQNLAHLHFGLQGIPQGSLSNTSDELLELINNMDTYFNRSGIVRALRHKLQLKMSADFDEIRSRVSNIGNLKSKQPLHMDFVRSNILFANDSSGRDLKVKISGIVDFEKASYGHPVFDIARSLSFLLVDCKYKQTRKVYKYFLESGYIKRGGSDLPNKHRGEIQNLINVFLLYDFYKFLLHNPYEYLPKNQHFKRTVKLLVMSGLVMRTTGAKKLQEHVKI